MWPFEDIGYLWECRKPREYRFKDRVPVCEFWTFEGSYEEFREKFAGKSHHDWCVFDRHEGKLRAGVRDMGIRLHWKCHFGFHIIQERLIGPLKEKNKILYGSSKLFSWDDVPGNDSEKLIRFLRDNLCIAWAENAVIHNKGKTILISKDDNKAEITIDEKEEKATLKIHDCRTTHDLKAKKENGKLNIYGYDDKLAKINKLTLMEEIFRRHYQELTGYRSVLSQQIDLEEKKMNTASIVIASILTVLFAIVLAIYQEYEIMTLWPIIIPIMVMLAFAVNKYLKSAVKSHEVKDAMYLCLGIDEDYPKLPGVPEKPHEEFPKEMPEVTDP